MKWPFYHLARLEYAYKHARENVRKIILKYVKDKNHGQMVLFEKTLVAPCGITADQDILFGLSKSFYGIDISPEALKSCPRNVITREGNILDSGYGDEFFDFIACFLFLHHVHKTGFGAFLKEFHRLLKKSGCLIILEPSSRYPLSRLMDLGRKIFGNISGLVPDEAPVDPDKLKASIEDSGFRIRLFKSVSFSHNRIPLPFQHLVNIITNPLQGVWPFSRAGWLCVWICEKI